MCRGARGLAGAVVFVVEGCAMPINLAGSWGAVEAFCCCCARSVAGPRAGFGCAVSAAVPPRCQLSRSHCARGRARTKAGRRCEASAGGGGGGGAEVQRCCERRLRPPAMFGGGGRLNVRGTDGGSSGGGGQAGLQYTDVETEEWDALLADRRMGGSYGRCWLVWRCK